jgi:cell division protein FtsB
MEQNTNLQRLKIIWASFSARFSNILIFIIILYFLFIVGRSTYGSYQDNQEIERQKQAIETLRLEVVYLENQNLYYQTESFKEKEARKKLGMIKPGETVVALDRNENEELTITTKKVADEIKKPNYIKWWNYFFSRE